MVGTTVFSIALQGDAQFVNVSGYVPELDLHDSPQLLPVSSGKGISISTNGKEVIIKLKVVTDTAVTPASLGKISISNVGILYTDSAATGSAKLFIKDGLGNGTEGVYDFFKDIDSLLEISTFTMGTVSTLYYRV